MEFSQWLCAKDFPLQDSVDQIDWAVDIMLNMQAEIDSRKEQGEWIVRTICDAIWENPAYGGARSIFLHQPFPDAHIHILYLNCAES